MAVTDSYTKHQKIDSAEQNQPNPSKFYYHFLYKAAIVTVFLIILPLFPSQAPEFINQTVFTRSWELLHLLFVGIAISYGLFSRRNDEAEKENNSKFDNAQSYVSRLLQVSSVFDDDAEIQSGSCDENKVQTWSSQYYRNEPVVVVAQENSVVDEQRGNTSRIGEKPLLLPVRSLKSRVTDPDCVVSVNETTNANSGSLSRSNSKSGSRRFSSNSKRSRNGDVGGSDNQELEIKLKESVVLPSPIPWRSRSGRMEMKDEAEQSSSPLYTLPPSMEESEFNRVESRVSRTQTSRSSRPNSANSSPKLSPSPSLSSPKKLTPSLSSFSSESHNVEDSVKKKSFYKVSFEKDFRRSFSSESKDLNLAAETQLRSHFDGLSMGKSVWTTRCGEAMLGRGREVDGKVERKGQEANSLIGRKRVGFEDQTSFKSDRHPSRESAITKPAFGELLEEEEEDGVEKVFVDLDDEEMDSEDDDDEVGASFIEKDIEESTRHSPNNDHPTPSAGSVSDGGPDVDKKADEFIAKFREQIRLQRIESIKRSSAQISRSLASLCFAVVKHDVHFIGIPSRI
ncbi:hypothetical protein FNV43_RR09004 [Rhamnella rubrinervis]|uniref:Uncharacterized protein n=1 Tax=Rhamnella rubrinervis TaxID=2594499 RepID=A0A8K0H977_9ROSA|nr:hypothetical protein FNV43_RR09004 [Rhamnella rubrinervis]